MSVKPVLLLLASIFIFSFVTALIKWMTADYSVFTISFFRNLFALLPAILVIAVKRPAVLRRATIPNGRLHAMRALTGFLSMLCLFQGYHLLPLADATVIYFCGPLLICVLAGLILKEQIGRDKMIAVLVGLCGVVLIASPTGADINSGVLFTLGGTFFYALSVILIRFLGKNEDPLIMSFYFALFATGFSLLLLPVEWRAPDLAALLALALIGVLAFIAQTLMNWAYKLGEASALAPLIYTSLIWNSVLGYLIWQDVPTVYTFAGAVLILGGNALLLWRGMRPKNGTVP